MHELFWEMLAKERLKRMEEFAAREAARRAARPPRRPLRVTLGLGLIRVGRWVLSGIPDVAAEPRRTA